MENSNFFHVTCIKAALFGFSFFVFFYLEWKTLSVESGRFFTLTSNKINRIFFSSLKFEQTADLQI